MHRDLKCGSSLLQVAASWTLGHLSLRFGCFFVVLSVVVFFC